MIADLSIAWLFWFLIRWPVIHQPVRAILRKLRISLHRLVREAQEAYRSARIESEEACLRELRGAGLVD